MSNSYPLSYESNDFEELKPYDWKQLPIIRPQGTPIEKIAESGAISHIWDMLNVIDIFSMSFVAQGLRETIINRAKSTKYMTKRGRQILLTTLNVVLEKDARGFLNIMRDHRLYIGGSSILHGIMYEHPSVNRWKSCDIDAYIKTDADFRMMMPKMEVLFKNFHDRRNQDKPYFDDWYYGYWTTNRTIFVRFGTTIDAISADHGIEWYDMTIVQNSITWDGRIRCTDPMAIIDRELHLAKSFASVLRGQIQTSSSHNHSIKSLLGSMLCNLTSRIEKYTERGFSLATDVTEMFKHFGMENEFLDYVSYFILYYNINFRGKSGIVDTFYCDNLSCGVLNCNIIQHYNSFK